MKWLKAWLLDRKKQPKYHEVCEKDDVSGLFEELHESFLKKIRIKKYYKDLEEKEVFLKQYEKFQTEELDIIQKNFNKYKNAHERVKSLQGRLIKNNKALYVMAKYEEVLPRLIHELKSVERKVKDSERDIFYLQEEKEELKTEREYLVKGYSALKGVSVLGVIGIALTTLLGGGLSQILREEIGLYMSGLSCLVVLLLGGFVGIKSYLEKRLKINEILQHKAVRYINKAKIRYFHNIRYLHFQLEQLEVDSVAKLEIYYNRYLKNKENEKEYSRSNKQLIEIEDILGQLFEAKEIPLENLNELQEWLLAPKKTEQTKEIIKEKQKILEQLKEIEEYENSLTEQLNELGKEEKYQEVIREKTQEYEKVMNTYLDKEAHCA